MQESLIAKLSEGIDQINGHLQAYLRKFNNSHTETRVLKQETLATVSEQLNIRSTLKEGGLGGKKLDLFIQSYLAHGQGMQHPANMGHQVAAPNPGGAWAELLHGVINNPMGIYEMGPSAATIEMEMVYWMLSKIGWQQEDRPLDTWTIGSPSGLLTHGGSMANLTCVLAARAAANPDAWAHGTDKSLTILAPESAHYCIERSAAICGLGTGSIRWIPTDEYDRILVTELDRIYGDAMAAGQRIMMVVANACITSTGLYDDLETIGRFCSKYDLWFHVDGAHGASALLSNKNKHHLKGIEHARSMIWDAHKMLRVPALSAAALFRDYTDMQKTFQQEGSYIFHDKDQPGIDTLAYTLECTKAELGTKIFMTLALQGEVAMADYIDSRYRLAQDAYDYISSLEDFECLVYPESNIICFNFKHGNALDIRKQIIADGYFYITTAEVKGKSWLRMTFMHPDTSMTEIEHLMKKITHYGE